MLEVIWPDASTLLKVLEQEALARHLTQRLASTPRVQGKRRAGHTVDVGVASDGEIALRIARPDDHGVEFVAEPAFPATLAELEELAHGGDEAVAGFLERRGAGPQLNSDDEVFSLSGDEDFADWMSAHVVGEEPSFHCAGYSDDGADPDEPGSAGMAVIVKWLGAQMTVYLPYPFSSAAFVEGAKAVTHLAACEWERRMYEHGWGSDNDSDVPILAALPWLQDTVGSFGDSLSELEPGDRRRRAAYWADICVRNLDADLAPGTLAALGFDRTEAIEHLTGAALEVAEYDDTSDEPFTAAISEVHDEIASLRPAPVVWGSAPVASRSTPLPSRRFEEGEPAPSTWFASHPHALPCAAAAALLLLAPAPHPYGYYDVLRVVVCGVGALVAYLASSWCFRAAPEAKTRYNITSVGAVVTAVLFNPLVPFTFERSTWAPIDIIAAGYFLAAIFAIERPLQSERGRR